MCAWVCLRESVYHEPVAYKIYILRLGKNYYHDFPTSRVGYFRNYNINMKQYLESSEVYQLIIILEKYNKINTNFIIIWKCSASHNKFHDLILSLPNTYNMRVI